MDVGDEEEFAYRLVVLDVVVPERMSYHALVLRLGGELPDCLEADHEPHALQWPR